MLFPYNVNSNGEKRENVELAMETKKNERKERKIKISNYASLYVPIYIPFNSRT